MNRALLALMLCPALVAQGGRVPSEAELAAARPGLVPILVARVQRLSGDNPQRAAGELLAAAHDAADDATRFLLWREAVSLAEGAGDLAFARNLELALAARFDLDPLDSTVALLQRAASSGMRSRAASAALFGLALAHERAADADDHAMLRLYDASTRAALTCDNTAVFAFVRDRLASLRSERDVIAALRSGASLSPERVGPIAASLMQGTLPRNTGLRLRHLQPLLESTAELAPDQELAELEPGDWLALAAHTPALELRRALWRCAATATLSRLRDEGGRQLAPAERTSLHATLIELTDRLASDDGVTRLRFAADVDKAQLAFANGDWRVEAGELRGAATGSDNFATHRVSFGVMRTVVIRGGIRSTDGLNFRCKVGDVNLLLNWEVADENHLWLNGNRFAVQPRLLQQGKEHTIAFLAEGLRCDVCIDGERIWSESLPSQLAGTITVYPALGSEIFVREILIDGDPDGVVDAPTGTLM